MAAITLQWDSSAVETWRDGVPKALVRALSKAGGDAIRTMRVGSSRAVRERKRFKVKRVNAALPVTFPRGKQDISSLEWRMDVSGRPVPLSELPHRQTKKGVVVEVNRGARKLVGGAFIATMRSGHKGIFRRRGVQRLPIDEAFTTRVSDVFQDSGFIDKAHAVGQAKFSSSFERLFALELDKLSR